MLYFLVTAMYPRFMITVDEDLNNLPVAVRVGQASTFVLLVPGVYLPMITGSRRGWTSWKASHDIRLPDTYNASTPWND